MVWMFWMWSPCKTWKRTHLRPPAATREGPHFAKHCLKCVSPCSLYSFGFAGHSLRSSDPCCM